MTHLTGIYYIKEEGSRETKLPKIKFDFFNPIVDRPSAAILIVINIPVVSIFNLIKAFNSTLFIVVTIKHTDSKAVVYSIEGYFVGGATLIDFSINTFDVDNDKNIKTCLFLKILQYRLKKNNNKNLKLN